MTKGTQIFLITDYCVQYVLKGDLITPGLFSDVVLWSIRCLSLCG